jgi:hypothetical protein
LGKLLELAVNRLCKSIVFNFNDKLGYFFDKVFCGGARRIIPNADELSKVRYNKEIFMIITP